jgi:hypothetical protein
MMVEYSNKGFLSYKEEEKVDHRYLFLDIKSQHSVCYKHNLTGKLASLKHSRQSNKSTFSALGMAGIEPMPSKSRATGP